MVYGYMVGAPNKGFCNGRREGEEEGAAEKEPNFVFKCNELLLDPFSGIITGRIPGKK